jgi:O-Antigen ligase/Tetratricopeptide repeat
MGGMAAAATRPLAPWSEPADTSRGRRSPRAAWLLGLGLLAATAFAAVSDGAIRVTDGSDLEIGLALLGIGALVAAVAGWGLHGRARAGAWPGVALLVAFGAWCALSITWSISPDDSWVEANRTWGYALVAGLGIVLGASLENALEKVAIGFLGLATLIALYALGGKLFPSVIDHAGEVSRLRSPLGYWNALGLFCALAVPLGLRVAADRRRGRLQIAALASLVILLSTLALTYSRGGIAVMVIAVGVLIALGPDRLRLACLSGAVVVGALPGLVVAFMRDDLTTDELRASQRADDGLLLLAGLAIGLVIALLLGRMVWRAGDSLRLGPRAAGALPKLAAGLGVVLILAIAGLAASGWLGDQVDGFTEPKAERQTDPARIVATNSSNRWVWWKEAVGATWDEPLFGYGAGSFPLVHLKYRTERLDVKQPHSVPLEFLSETGIIGAGLGLGGLALLAAAGVGRIRNSTGTERAYAGALIAACLAWGLHIWVDWDWDIPGVTVPVLLFLGVLAAKAPGSTAETPRRRRGLLALLTGGVVLALVAVSALLPALAREKSDDALAEAAERGPAHLREADEKAATARRLDPLAIDPIFTSADLALRRGDVPRAAELLADAVRDQPDNPRLWTRLARIQALFNDSPGAQRSARMAVALDPFSFVLFTVGSPLSYDASRSATATGTPLPAAPTPPVDASPTPQDTPPTDAPAQSGDIPQVGASPPSAPAPTTPSP